MKYRHSKALSRARAQATTSSGALSIQYDRVTASAWRAAAGTLAAGTMVFCALTGNAAVAATHAATPSGSSYYVQAPVLHAEPIVTKRYVDHPVQQCALEYPARPAYQQRVNPRDEEYPPRSASHRHKLVPGLIGGLIGGLVGNQFGGGHGKKALTIIGALAGSSIAREAVHHSNDRYTHNRHDMDYAQIERRGEPVRRCRTTHESKLVESIDGYLVTYEYAGKTFNKRVPQHPGDEISVRVRVTPASGS